MLWIPLNCLNPTIVCEAFTQLFYARLYAQTFDGLSDDIANGDFLYGEIIYEDYFRGTFEINTAEVTTTVELIRITGDCS